MLKKLILIIALSLFSSPAFAFCLYNGNQIDLEPVEYSSRATVRQAYEDNSCIVTKLWHPGGDPCVEGNPNTNHVTVRADGRTYHVFDFRDPENAEFFCTTP